VDAANDVIAGAKDNGLLSGRIDKPFLYFEDATKDEQSDANPQIVHSRVFAKQIPWFIQREVKDITRQRRAEFTVLVLSPTRTQCHVIYEALKGKGFENVQFAGKADNREASLLDGLRLLLADGKSNLGWRIVSKKLLETAAFEAALRQTDGEGDAKDLVGMLDAALKKQVRCMLTALRRVRDGKELTDDQRTGLLGQIGIDAYAAATESLREELGSGNQSVVDPGIRRTSIVVTTIQSSKGLAADYVFIAHFDDRYCVRDRDGRISDQDVCSFLVALTRARRRAYLLSTDSTQTPTFLTWIAKGRLCEVKSPGADEA